MAEAEETNIVQAGVEALLKPLYNLIEKLAGPAAEELGETLRDTVKVYRWKRQVRLLQKVDHLLKASGVEPYSVAPRLLLSISDAAAVEGDEFLHNVWAALLANAAHPELHNQAKPYYVEILKQLSGDQARLLTNMYKIATRSYHDPDSIRPEWPWSVSLGDSEELWHLYCRSNQDAEHDNKSTDFIIAIENLERLGLIQTLSLASLRGRQPARRGRVAQIKERVYAISVLAYHFISACQPPGTIPAEPWRDRRTS